MEQEILRECHEIADFLVEKNKAYGDSVSSPIGIFASDEDPIVALNVRIDDKLSRIKRGNEYPGDDTILDLIGYLILLRILRRDPDGI